VQTQFLNGEKLFERQAILKRIKDMALFANLGINPEKREEHSDEAVAEAIVTQAVKQEESKLL